MGNKKLSKSLAKCDNEVRLQRFILKYLQEKAAKHNKEVLYSVVKECVNIETGIEYAELKFGQAEADTIMLSVYSVLRSNGFNGDIVIDSKDTDVYIAAAHVAHLYPGKLLIK